MIPDSVNIVVHSRHWFTGYDDVGNSTICTLTFVLHVGKKTMSFTRSWKSSNLVILEGHTMGSIPSHTFKDRLLSSVSLI